MRVKLQLVLCSDEGQEETVTEVITLNKNSQRIEHLGLTMAEAKQRHCQVNEKSLSDTFPVRKAKGLGRAKILGLVKAQNLL